VGVGSERLGCQLEQKAFEQRGSERGKRGLGEGGKLINRALGERSLFNYGSV